MERITLFVDVILPLPVRGVFTYRVPFEMNGQAEAGRRVAVPFGRKKIYAGLVRHVHQKPPKSSSVKYILSVLDEQPIVHEKQFRLWEWMASYYLCGLGEVMQAALPSAYKLASETRVVLSDRFDGDYTRLTDKEYLVTEALEVRKVLTLTEVSAIVEQKKILPLIHTLIEKGVIVQEEELLDTYKPKQKVFVLLEPAYYDENRLKEVFDQLSNKAFKQLAILMAFVELCGHHLNSREIGREDLLKRARSASAQLNALIDKGVFRLESREISLFPQLEATGEKIQLETYQQRALDQIQENFCEKEVVLLHGVTSSGKTLVYIRLIAEMLASGKQVLYLLPEIALTTQIIKRLQAFFGSKVAVYHSRFNKRERVDIWKKLNSQDQEQSAMVILGPRSALFLPYTKLGLVVIDEEHDVSYKQYEPAPRYNARDTAIYLAMLHGAKTILGTATPAVESYHNALSGKYGLVEMTTRYGSVQMPEVMIADLGKERKEKTMHSHFSSLLLKQIEMALAQDEQVILFQNRRGFSLRLECEKCGWMPVCHQCDVTLTYHKHVNALQCHYCGFRQDMPESCAECGNTDIRMKGFGTEKIEDELPLFFPEARIARMDLDTTRQKYAYQQIIADFEQHKTDILVGTQMVTKGLDFDRVSVVGILNADNMLSFPDFRAFERSYQLIAQVSGRSGRKDKQGRVVLQTYNPAHVVIRQAIDNNYLAMFKQQLEERRNFAYPPFYKLIRITLKHRDADPLNACSLMLAEALRGRLKERILGPEYPVVSRIRGLYLKNILIKVDRQHAMVGVKKRMVEILDDLARKAIFKGVRLVIDVDPY